MEKNLSTLRCRSSSPQQAKLENRWKKPAASPAPVLLLAAGEAGRPVCPLAQWPGLPRGSDQPGPPRSSPDQREGKEGREARGRKEKKTFSQASGNEKPPRSSALAPVPSLQSTAERCCSQSRWAEPLNRPEPGPAAAAPLPGSVLKIQRPWALSGRQRDKQPHHITPGQGTPLLRNLRLQKRTEMLEHLQLARIN